MIHTLFLLSKVNESYVRSLESWLKKEENDVKVTLDAGSISDDVVSHIVESYKVSRKENIAGGVKDILVNNTVY